jgi:V8-like Glu-specific endopeptidase
MAVTEDVRARREALVVEHMESENRHEYDATIETFDHPRYELIGTGDVHDGAELGIARDPLALGPGRHGPEPSRHGRPSPPRPVPSRLMPHAVDTRAGKVAVGLAIGLAASALWTAMAVANPVAVKSAPGAESAVEAKAVKEYWTPRRMRQAEPLDVTPTPREVARAARASAGSTARGEVGTVRPTKGAKPLVTELEVPTANRVRSPSRYPYRTQGKAFFRWRGGDYVCSATTVNTPTKRVIFTAGHCIIDEGSRSSRFAFVPGYENGSRPYGTFVATRLFWIQAWGRRGNFSYDVGAAVLGGARKVGQVVGTRGFKWNLPRQQNFLSYGYPAGFPYNGEQLYNCPSPYRGLDRSTSPPRTQWITCDMTAGSSGGGWIVRGEYLNSVNSYGYVTQPNRMYGPYFGSAVKRLYNRVRNKTP